MAVNSQKFLPSSTRGGSIVKSSSAIVSASKISSRENKDTFFEIKVKVIEIDKILKGTLALKKKQLDDKKKSENEKGRKKQEEKLERKPKDDKDKVKLPGLPRTGFLDGIKNFIGKILLGYFAYRLVEHLPKILPIINFIGSASDFIINVGGKLLNGLATFIDWGYKAYDATRGFIKNIGGENFAQGFDKFVGAIDTTLFLTTFIAGDLLLDALTGDDGGGLGDFVGDQLKRRGAQQAATTAAGQAGGTAAKAGSIGAGTVAAIVAGAGLLASALGEGAFQLRKVATKPIQDAKKAYDREKNPLMKIGRGAFLGGMNTLLGPLSAIGVLLDVVGAPFRYAIELLRFPFLSDEDKQKQANNLAKFDARIREDFRKALNMVTLGFAFKEKGSFGNIYGNKGAQKEMMGKMAGGGVTRGGKTQGSIKRSLKKTKGKYKRVLAKKPGEVEIKPGADVGGEDKIFGIFPNPLKKVKDAVDYVNPFNVVKTAGEDLGKSNYFGPILAITSKIILGQKPSKKDYENVGLGINMLISKGIQDQQLKGGIVAAFAEGGLVDPDVLSAVETGGDISNWVAKTFQGEVESNAEKTLRMIKENAEKKQLEKQKSEDGGGGAGSEDGFEVGPAGSSGDKLTMARNLMRDLGLTAAQAAGIVGNMAAESGVENARPQGSKPGTKAPLKVDGVTGYGLVQWTSKGRQQALADFARSRGADLSKPLSMDIEYQFFLKEFKGAYGNVLKQIKNAPDVKTASTIFMQQYEIPAGYKTEAKIMERYNMSKPIYDKLARGEGKATEGVGTYIGSSASSISLGKGYGKGGMKIAGDLGDFMKANRSKVPVTGSIHRHPRHLPWAKSGHSVGSLHYEGRAIDLGGWAPSNKNSGGRDEQAPVIKSVIDWNKRYGYSPVQLIHHSPKYKNVGSYRADHNDHVHVAYEEGGETLNGPHLAIIGEKGKEVVIDNDSTVSDPQAKNMLLAVNQASNRKGVIDAIREYAPYDAMSEQTIVVPMANNAEDDYGEDSSGGFLMAMGGGEGGSFDELYVGG